MLGMFFGAAGGKGDSEAQTLRQAIQTAGIGWLTPKGKHLAPPTALKHLEELGASPRIQGQHDGLCPGLGPRLLATRVTSYGLCGVEINRALEKIFNWALHLMVMSLCFTGPPIPESG